MHRCIKKTCKSIWDILSGSYMKPPTRQDWVSIEQKNCTNAREVDLIVMACVVLHNFLTEQRDLPALYQRINPDNIPYLRDDGAILAVPNLHGYHTPAQAKAISYIYTTYFNRPEEGLPWQHKAALHEWYKYERQTYLQILVTVVRHWIISYVHSLKSWWWHRLIIAGWLLLCRPLYLWWLLH